MNPSGRETWLWWDSGHGDPLWNMAVDEVLLKQSETVGLPLLRFYGWTRPAATFGYFQSFRKVETLTQLRPLVRRPTGGGLVPHESDWTYSLAIPPDHEWWKLRARESYRRIHDWLRRAFERLDLGTSLSPALRPEEPGQCFVGAERHDLLWRNRKIAGAAQRRNRNGLLIQGSIQSGPLDLDRSDWQRTLLAEKPVESEVTWKNWEAEKTFLAGANQLADSKYANPNHNQRR